MWSRMPNWASLTTYQQKNFAPQISASPHKFIVNYLTISSNLSVKDVFIVRTPLIACLTNDNLLCTLPCMGAITLASLGGSWISQRIVSCYSSLLSCGKFHPYPPTIIQYCSILEQCPLVSVNRLIRITYILLDTFSKIAPPSYIPLTCLTY